MYRVVDDARNMLGKIYYLGGNGVVRQYNLSLHMFRQMDEDNYDKFSQMYIGKMYLEGLANEKNEELGFKYLKKSAEQEVTQAQISLAYAYVHGKGTDEDRNKALYWIERAVNNNSSEAKYLLGIAYYYGDDQLNVKIDEKYGMKLLMEASEAGVEEARQEIEKIKKEQTITNKPDIDSDYMEDRSENKRNWFSN